MKRKLILLILLATISSLVIPSSAGATAPRTAVSDKAGFLADTGVASYAFKHFVYQRFLNGAFAQKAPNRTRDLTKGAAALAVSYNHLQAAYTIAGKSKDASLHMLVHPLNILIGQARWTYTRFKNGRATIGDVALLNDALATFSIRAAHFGIQIKDVPMSIPAAS
jgi:hypothetical protein